MFGLSPKCLDKRKNKYLKFIHSGVSFMLTNAQRKVDKFVLEPNEKLSLWVKRWVYGFHPKAKLSFSEKLLFRLNLRPGCHGGDCNGALAVQTHFCFSKSSFLLLAHHTLFFLEASTWMLALEIMNKIGFFRCSLGSGYFQTISSHKDKSVSNFALVWSD